MGMPSWSSVASTDVGQVASNVSTFGGDLSKGFITAGVSGGGNLTNAVTYLARDNKLHPPLTGTLLQCTGMVHQHTDSQGRSFDMYRDKLVSWDRLEDAPIVSRGTVKVYGGKTLRIIYLRS